MNLSRNLRAEQMLEMTSRAKLGVGIFATSRRSFGLHRSRASRILSRMSRRFGKMLRTSQTTLSLISWNSATATTSSGSPPWRSAITRIPSSSRSLSMSHLFALLSEVHAGKTYCQPHRGLSGMNKEPRASNAPITVWTDSGILQELSDSMKEQK